MFVRQRCQDSVQVRLAFLSGSWLSHECWRVRMETIGCHLREVNCSMLAGACEDCHSKKMDKFVTFLEGRRHFLIDFGASSRVAILMEITNPILNFTVLNNNSRHRYEVFVNFCKDRNEFSNIKTEILTRVPSRFMLFITLVCILYNMFNMYIFYNNPRTRTTNVTIKSAQYS